jgi:uncharacterized RDD family membrane protein YckC
MKYFALIILLVLLATALVAIFLLARWPGQIARGRNHPQADAVGVAGWCSLLLPIPLWPLAMVWAYYAPANTGRAQESAERIGAGP